MELEGVNFKVTAETGQLEQADAHVQQFAAMSEQAQKSVDKFGNQLTQADKAAGRFVDATGRMREKTGQFVKGLQSADKSLASFNSNAAASSTAAGKASGGMSKMSTVAGQLSFQLQDVAVQAQAGTNAFTILAQQGPQIASVFGPAGAVAGAVIGIGAAIGGTLVTSMMDAGDQASELAEEMGLLAKRTGEFEERIKDLTLFQSINRQAEAADNVARIKNEIEQLDIRIQRASFMKDDQSTPLRAEMELLEVQLSDAQLAMQQYDQQIEFAMNDTAGAADQTERLVDALELEAATLGMTSEERALHVLWLKTENKELLAQAAVYAQQIKAQRERIEAEAAARKAANERRQQLDKDIKSAEQYLQQIGVLNKTQVEREREKTDTMIAELERYRDQGIITAEQLAAARTQVEISANNKLIQSLRNIRGQLNPTERLYNQYYNLIQQIADSTLDAALKTELMGEAYQKLQDDIERANEKLGEHRREADPYAEAWEEATKRIDDSFAKAWEGAFDSFESFADSIMGSFKTLLANLAHQAISKPILISMGIGGGLGGAGSAAASTGAAGGGFSLSNIGSMFSGNGIGSMISDFGGWVGGSSPLAGTGAGNFISGATANAANISNLAWGAGGIGGGLLSNALGLSGQYSGITGAAGTAIGGTLLAPVLGPFAPLAGSFLGSALGGLFGNDEPSNMEGRAIIDNLANPSLRISGQSGDKFSQENRDAAANIAGIIQQNILGTIGGLSGQEFGGELIVGMGDRDPFRFRYTDEEGQSFGLGRSGSQGISFDERIGANTRDVNEYLETITQFFADQANLDLSVYEQFQNENELLIEVVARISAQMNTMVSAADLLNLSFDGTEEQLMRWSDNIAQAAGGLDVLQAATARYYDNFFTDAEKLEDLTESLTAAFNDLGVALPDTREGFRAIIEGLDLTTESGQEMYAALLQLNPQVAEYINGLEQVGSVMDRLMGRADTALSGVMSAIRAERDALTDRYNSEREAILANQEARQDQLEAEQDAFRELERSYSALDRAFGRMNMTDSASVFSRASGATEYLRAALASGGIPTADELEPYLAAAQEPTEELFESFEDYARQFFVAKNLIGELRERAGDQLTTEEKALREAEKFHDNQLSALERQYDLDMEALDQQAEEAQSLYDAVTGVNDGILSVVEAIQQLEASLADVLAGVEGSGGTFGSITDQSGSDVRTIDIAGDPIVEAYNRLFGRDPDVAGYRYWAGMIESGAVGAGSLDDFIMGGARGIDVPGFANGGTHSGGLRIVGERGPELEYTGPSRIMNNGDLMDAMSSGAATERAVRSMDQNLMAGMRAIEKNTREIKQLQRRWDQQGLPPERTFE